MTRNLPRRMTRKPSSARGSTVAQARLVVQEMFGASTGGAEAPCDGRAWRGLCPLP
jgi:hypothetical protein